MVSQTISIPRDMFQEVDNIAVERGWTFSGAVQFLIKNGLARQLEIQSSNNNIVTNVNTRKP